MVKPCYPSPLYLTRFPLLCAIYIYTLEVVNTTVFSVPFRFRQLGLGRLALFAINTWSYYGLFEIVPKISMVAISVISTTDVLLYPVSFLPVTGGHAWPALHNGHRHVVRLTSTLYIVKYIITIKRCCCDIREHLALTRFPIYYII